MHNKSVGFWWGGRNLISLVILIISVQMLFSAKLLHNSGRESYLEVKYWETYLINDLFTHLK